MNFTDFERIFDRNASVIMDDWNFEDFKNSHPSLYKTILLSMASAVEEQKNKE